MVELRGTLCGGVVTAVRVAAGTAAASAALVGLWVAYRKWKWSRSPLSRLPNPPEPSFIFGQFLALGASRQAGEVHAAWLRQYGNMVAYDMSIAGTRVMICDAEAIRRVLVSNVTNYSKPGFVRILMHKLIGQSMILAEGECHKRQRKIISDAFRFENLSRLSVNFSILTDKLVNAWLQRIHEFPLDTAIEIDLKQTVHDLTMDIIGVTGFGYDFKASTGERTDLALSYADVLSCTAVTFSNTINHLWPFNLLPLPGVLKERRAHNHIRAMVLEMVNQRRRAMLAAPTSEDAARLQSDLLGLMLRAADADPAGGGGGGGGGGGAPGLTDTEVKDNVIAFLLAGHETTATHLAWTLYLLARHPAAARRVRREVRRATGGARLPAAGDLEALPFLTAVLKESLRLYPPFPFSARVAVKDGAPPPPATARRRPPPLKPPVPAAAVAAAAALSRRRAPTAAAALYQGQL